MNVISNEPNPSSISSNGSSKSLWTNFRFMRMFIAYSLATFGDWFDALAIQVMVAYRWGADPLIIALIPVCMAVPGIVLGSVAGALADRLHKVKIMMICDVITVLLTIAILFAPSAAWLLPLLALRAMMGVFHVPAQQALTRQVVAEEHLFQASSLNGFVNQCSKVAGPLLGAVIVAVFSPQVCILINACTRLLSGVVLWPLRRLTEDPEPSASDGGPLETGETAESLFIQWQKGWRFIQSSRTLLSTILFGCFGLMAILMIDYQFTTLFREIKPGNEALIGWLGSSAGAGAVVIILLLNRLPRIGYGWGLGGGYLLIGAGIAALGWVSSQTSEFWIIIWGLCIGVGNGLFMVTLNYLLQKETPPAYVGRVFGIQNSLSSVVLVIAPLAGGALIRSVGPSPTFQYIGMATLAIGFAGMMLQRILWKGQQPLPAESTGELGQKTVRQP
ncbi:Predicted arabinose efflux permease, MFS family [Paenibacillus sp. OK060]|uniref:MFS transporter n=1 Tax=Paenibacillus sp. OK060 TaxID=1881034 RepID=UPI00088555C9|nr:MFS transporter [Paenibacillus sp. OK060]SDK95073.1 Predicted arabinose efflux permease, MFS family [Paenibacillus sp. OK060]